MQLTREMLRLIDRVSPDDISRYPLPRVNEEVGDRVIGELPEGLRKAYIFYMTAKHDLERMHKSLQERLDNAKTKKAVKRITTEREVTQLMFDHTKRNFLDELRYLFPELIGESHIAIKAGWKVVVFVPATSIFFCYLKLAHTMLPRKTTKHL